MGLTITADSDVSDKIKLSNTRPAASSPNDINERFALLYIATEVTILRRYYNNKEVVVVRLVVRAALSYPYTHIVTFCTRYAVSYCIH